MRTGHAEVHAAPLVVFIGENAVASPQEVREGLRSFQQVVLVLDCGAATDLWAALLTGPGRETVDEDELPRRCPRAAGVVCLSEDMVERASAFARSVGSRGLSSRSVELVRDKRAQRSALSAAGLHHVVVYEISGVEDVPDASSHLGYPFVIKPAQGVGSMHVRLVDNESDAVSAVEDYYSCNGQGSPLPPLMGESYLRGRRMGSARQGDYVSVESVVCDGEIVHLGVTGKFPLAPPFRETGQFYPSRLSAQDESALGDLASAALRALGVDNGCAHTEIKLTDAGPRLIEVNGRLGGFINELYQRATGVSLVEVVCRAACGVAPDGGAGRREQVRPGLFFQFNHVSPVGATNFLDVRGARDAVAVPGVHSFKKNLQRGSQIPQDHRSMELDLLTGWAQTLDGAGEVIKQAGARLVFEFETNQGRVSETGLRLQEKAFGTRWIA